MTQFAEVYTAKSDAGISSLLFNVWNLVLIILSVYGLLNIFQSKTAKGKLIASVLFLASAGYLVYQAINVTGSVDVEAPIFQQFNPCFVVALTPIVMLVFGALSKRGKEPSSPMKIGLGMLVAGIGFVVLLVGSKGLNTPEVQEADQIRYEKAQLEVAVNKTSLLLKEVALPIAATETSDTTSELSHVVHPMYGDSEVLPMSYMGEAKEEIANAIAILKKKDVKRSDIIDVQKVLVAQYDSIYNVCEAKLPATLKSQIQKQDVVAASIPAVGYVSPNWLIITYFILTIAELLLSPIGISFVSKVAPPKYKGMMMGGWFVATAIGNFLVAVPALLWGSRPLYVVWGVLIAVCLVSALFIFSILKRLEKVAK
jgi:MFS family permease